MMKKCTAVLLALLLLVGAAQVASASPAEEGWLIWCGDVSGETFDVTVVSPARYTRLAPEQRIETTYAGRDGAHGIAGAAVLLLCASVELIATVMYEDYRGVFFRIMFCIYNAIFGIVRYIAGKRNGASQETGSLWLVFGLLMTGFTVAFLCFLFRDLKAGAI